LEQVRRVRELEKENARLKGWQPIFLRIMPA
jgi:hypothetical protein